MQDWTSFVAEVIPGLAGLPFVLGILAFYCLGNWVINITGWAGIALLLQAEFDYPQAEALIMALPMAFPMLIRIWLVQRADRMGIPKTPCD
ncbi:hypothetical protein [Gluconacetobacter asukensis]|uniref:Uncharacterized protein n=1 Tax=Gluconacetobacter asukensis TaxID=1017181 RepID=A0A7W4J1A2_9PROT|nr:hypothetical protein [Gluconacetobacter asukensis]MBB2172880.1 hypothetical protein [Gluconacetobacter asukensis]